jgi:hypothetical protein
MVQGGPARCSEWARSCVAGSRASIMVPMVRASRCTRQQLGTTALGRTGSYSRRTMSCSGRGTRSNGASPLNSVFGGPEQGRSG